MNHDKIDGCIDETMKYASPARVIFLSVVAVIALSIGAVALLFPAQLLASKGVLMNDGTILWMREVGALLVCIGVIIALVRKHEDSPTLQALMFGNLLIQLGLLVLEVVGYQRGIITELSGVLPNSILHLCLIVGFGYFLKR